jgi:predicted Zn-dependent protease
MIGLVAQGCALNPVSGQPEVVFISVEKEKEIGAQQARKIEKALGVVSEPPAAAMYVDAVGRRLVEHSPRRDVDYTFRIIDMNEPNAFALPSGHVYVSRGLLPLVNSEDELAGVIAHEIAHVEARHAAQRMTAAAATAPITILTGIAGLATGVFVPSLGKEVAGLGQTAANLVLAPYSRSQEREADRVGQEIAADAGWNPLGISVFLATLEREEALRSEEPRLNSFFATHPSTPERVTDTSLYADQLAVAPLGAVTRDRNDFLSRFDGLLIGDDPAQGLFQDGWFLHPDFDFALRLPPRWRMLNSRYFVITQAPTEDALLILLIAGIGEDALRVAEALDKQMDLDLLAAKEVTVIGGLPAVRSFVTVQTPEGRLGLDLTWIAHRGLVYQIMGLSPVDRFSSYRGIFTDTVQSFVPLSSTDRFEIKEARLRIIPAHRGESLSALLRRVDGLWNVERTALMNGVSVGMSLAEGQLIKVPIRQPYKAKSIRIKVQPRQSNATQ